MHACCDETLRVLQAPYSVLYLLGRDALPVLKAALDLSINVDVGISACDGDQGICSDWTIVGRFIAHVSEADGGDHAVLDLEWH